MVRAAAKNYNDVIVITRPKQYNELIKELNSNNGSTSLDFRQKMSEEAFNETAYYDALIANYFNKKSKNLSSLFKIMLPLFDILLIMSPKADNSVSDNVLNMSCNSCLSILCSLCPLNI